MWMKNQRCNIMFIQESHFSKENEKKIENEFKGNIFHSHGNTQSRGVTILIKDELKSKVINTVKDDDGRFLLINIEIKDNIYTLE